MEVAQEPAQPRAEEGEQDVMSTQQLQGLLGKHGYSIHLVDPFSGSGESEEEGELVVGKCCSADGFIPVHLSHAWGAVARTSDSLAASSFRRRNRPAECTATSTTGS